MRRKLALGRVGEADQVGGVIASLLSDRNRWINAQSIALTGRIVAVADVFDALCSKRPYKRGWAKPEAGRFVVSGRSTQFDPDVVDAFVAVLSARDPELGDQLR